MFLIKKSQIDSLLQDDSFNLALQAYDHVRKFIPKELEQVSKDNFIIAANKQIDNAIKYGVKDEEGQITYTLVSFLFGEQFDTDLILFNNLLTKWKLKDSEKGEVLLNATIEIFNAMEES